MRVPWPGGEDQDGRRAHTADAKRSAARAPSRVGGQGLEPRFSGPKPDVLPLDDPPGARRRIVPQTPVRTGIDAPAGPAARPRSAPRRAARSHRGDASVSCTCKHSCTLSTGTTRTVRSAARGAGRRALAAPAPVALAAAPRRRPARAPRAPAPSLRPNGANAAAIDAATLCLDRPRPRRPPPARAARQRASSARVAASQVASMVRRELLRRRAPRRADAAVADRRDPLPARTPRRSPSARTSPGAPGATQPPRSIVAAWMASPPHRAIMLCRRLPRRRRRRHARAARRAPRQAQRRDLRDRVRRAR